MEAFSDFLKAIGVKAVVRNSLIVGVAVGIILMWQVGRGQTVDAEMADNKKVEHDHYSELRESVNALNGKVDQMLIAFGINNVRK